MEVKLILCIVVKVSEKCSEEAVYCSHGCCDIFPYGCCKEQVAGVSTGTCTIVPSWVIALVIIGVILVAFTITAIICCVRRSRGAMGTVIDRQGMIMMTTSSAVYTTNGHQQASVWQYIQNSTHYYQQPAPSSQQPITTNSQQYRCQTGKAHVQTAEYAHLPSCLVNDTQLFVILPPADDNIAHGEPLKCNEVDSSLIQVSNVNVNFQ